VQRSVANHKGTSFGQGETTINKDIMVRFSSNSFSLLAKLVT
jgi:hypothetical protein